MRKNVADVVRALRGDLNPDPSTRADGDCEPQLQRGAAPARVTPRSAAAPAALTRDTMGRVVDARELPYDPKVGVLPESELRRLLKKHANAERGPKRNEARFTVKDIAALSHTDPAQVRRLKHDMVSATLVVPIPARKRLSQCLLRMDAGLIVKRNGVVEKLSEPEIPTKPPMMFRVLFSPSGRVTIAKGEPPPKARPFPRMFGDWNL